MAIKMNIQDPTKVYLEPCHNYDKKRIAEILNQHYSIFESAIKPGNAVSIKPNFVKEGRESNKREWLQIITNPILIKETIRIVSKTLQGKGKIIIADGPQTDSSFKKIFEKINVEEWFKIVDGTDIQLKIIDLRDHEYKSLGSTVLFRKKLLGDPRGSVEVDLKDNSEFLNHTSSKFGYYGADNDIEETNKAHNHYHHKYRVSKSIIETDVFINMPKLKSHKKAGITCCLKNLVGINTYRNYLPHYNLGTPKEGGDQFLSSTMTNRLEAKALHKIYNFVKTNKILSFQLLPLKIFGKSILGKTNKVIRSGNWYGNDAIWRMILDLNKILFFANIDGTLKTNNFVSAKKYIGIVDGIIGGQGQGPMDAEAINSNALIIGTNPVAIDAVCAKYIGFDYKKIPSIANAFNVKSYPFVNFKYDDIRVVSSDKRYNKNLKFIRKEHALSFAPHFGWKGQIEL
jgi:uncharacterized protein (DUF362 family)